MTNTPMITLAAPLIAGFLTAAAPSVANACGAGKVAAERTTESIDLSTQNTSIAVVRAKNISFTAIKSPIQARCASTPALRYTFSVEAQADQLNAAFGNTGIRQVVFDLNGDVPNSRCPVLPNDGPDFTVSGETAGFLQIIPEEIPLERIEGEDTGPIPSAVLAKIRRDAKEYNTALSGHIKAEIESRSCFVVDLNRGDAPTPNN